MNMPHCEKGKRRSHATAQRRNVKAQVMAGWFPSSGSRCFTQVRARRKSRHFGRDAEIQAMDGNKSVVQMLGSGNMPYRSFMFAVAGASVVAPSLPSLDAGFRHPCRNDGPPTLVYNDERSSAFKPAGAWERSKFSSQLNINASARQNTPHSCFRQ